MRSKPDPKSKYYSVQLKCPMENSGIFEEISENKYGQIIRTRGKVEVGVVTKIIVETALPGKGLQVEATYNIEKPADKAESSAGKLRAAEISKMLNDVCNNPRELAMYRVEATYNKLIVSNQAVKYSEGDDIASRTSYQPIAVRCPRKDDSGELVHIKKNADGYIGYIQLLMRRGKTTKLVLKKAGPGERYQIVDALDADNPTDGKEEDYFKRMVTGMKVILDNGCKNPSNWPRFNAMMAQRREELSGAPETLETVDEDMFEFKPR